MKLTADYHTHTVHSHGTGSVADNVEAALARGLSAVGIADHSVSHALYGVKRGRVGYYLECIARAKERFAGRIEVRAGIELNLTGLEGSYDLPQGAFDIVILGYHKAAWCADLRTAWTFFRGRRVDAITQAYVNAIQTARISIVAHPGYGVPVNYRLLARACADYGALFEINEKHAGLSPEDIDEAAAEPVKFVISSDAHRPESVGRAPQALALAQRAGLKPGRIINATEE
jgi:Histidinol phosphatase and related hydrolases of the PHP family